MTAAAPQRLYGLDVARIVLVILVVMAHVGMTYISLPVWAAYDGFDMIVALQVFLAQLSIMITFFLISGFAARALFVGKGEAFFIRDRLIRIVLPLIVFGLGYYAVVPFIWRLGDRAITRYGTGVADGFNPVIEFPLTHLWFLYVIAIFYALTVALVRVRSTIPAWIDRWMALAVNSWITPLLFGMPIAAAMTLFRGWDPMTSIPPSTLVPSVHVLVAFGAAYLYGWYCHRQPELLGVLARRWTWLLAGALLMLPLYFAVVWTWPIDIWTSRKMERLPYALAFGVLSWTVSLAGLSAALRFARRPGPVVQFLSASSYWVYIAHMIPALLLPILMLPLPLPPLVKYLIASAGSMALLLVSYRWLIRGGPIDRWLNGPAKLAKPAAPAANPAPAA